MKRTLSVLLALAIGVTVAHAKRWALLVGVNQYSFEPATDHLRGGPNDIGVLKILLGACGFETPTSITEANAKHALILKKLAELEAKAGSGDQVLFYFTGRGSVDAKKPGGTDLQPTLVPFDGVAATSQNDLTMAELEGWAKRIQAKGASPVVILDAAYHISGDPAKRENRFYEKRPKMVVRSGKPRAEVWKGPGVCLSATDMTGNAFEWRVDFATNKWRSAFTDLFVEWILFKFDQKVAVTYADAQTQIAAYWARDRAYMPGTRPYPAKAALSGPYAKPLFALTNGGTSVTPTPEAQQAAQEEVQAFVKSRQTLRVAIDADDNVQGTDARKALIAKYTPTIGAYVQKNLENVEIVAEAGARKDRSLYVSTVDGKLRIRVIGDELTAQDQVAPVGNDVNEVFTQPIKATFPANATLGQYLQFQTYTQQLWNFIEVNKPTLDNEVRLSVGGSSFRPGDSLTYSVSGDAKGYLYVFDQDDSDGVVELVFPGSRKREPLIDQSWSSSPVSILSDTPPGSTLVRALVVGKPDDSSLPPIVVSADDFPAAFLAHFKALVAGIESGSLKWRTAEVKYTVAH